MSFLQRFYHNYRRIQLGQSPQLNLVWGFFLYTLIGVVLLSLPIAHKEAVPFVDNLFAATSAVSTTGLMTVSTFGTYNFFGQLVLVALFQIGGIGYMTLTTYFLLFTTRQLTPWHTRLLGAEFTMPQTIRMDDFIKSVIVFTLVMETLGTVGFYFAFEALGKGFWDTLWFAIFHSVSAFCTAGFSLFDEGFVPFQADPLINALVAVLAIAGSLGFIVITDVWYRITGRSRATSFTTRLIVVGFSMLLIGGTVLIYLTEPLMQVGEGSPLLKSFFQAMTATTTVGFNTVDTGALRLPILLAVTFLMYVGASPSGTAGGMKVTTLIAMFSVLKSRILGERKINFLQRVIPFERLYVATSTFVLYTSLIFLFTLLLSFTEVIPLDRLLFEVASALGTVGLSTGITGDFTTYGKLMIVVLMFIGRVGVLTFGFALLARRANPEIEFREDDLAV